MLSVPKIFHRFYARQSSKNHVLLDLQNRIVPIVAARIDDQYSVWRYLAGNLETPEILKTTHKQSVNEAMKIQVLVRLLQDQIQHHLDLMKVVMFEIS